MWIFNPPPKKKQCEDRGCRACLITHPLGRRNILDQTPSGVSLPLPGSSKNHRDGFVGTPWNATPWERSRAAQRTRSCLRIKRFARRPFFFFLLFSPLFPLPFQLYEVSFPSLVKSDVSVSCVHVPPTCQRFTACSGNVPSLAAATS